MSFSQFFVLSSVIAACNLYHPLMLAPLQTWPFVVSTPAKEAFDFFDTDGSGFIDYDKFLKMMTHKILNCDPKDEILKAFCLFDDDETGKTPFNLKPVAKEFGARTTDEELQEMMDEADRDGDGEVNEEEFLPIMKKTNLF